MHTYFFEQGFSNNIMIGAVDFVDLTQLVGTEQEGRTDPHLAVILAEGHLVQLLYQKFGHIYHLCIWIRYILEPKWSCIIFPSICYNTYVHRNTAWTVTDAIFHNNYHYQYYYKHHHHHCNFEITSTPDLINIPHQRVHIHQAPLPLMFRRTLHHLYQGLQVMYVFMFCRHDFTHQLSSLVLLGKQKKGRI